MFKAVLSGGSVIQNTGNNNSTYGRFEIVAKQIEKLVPEGIEAKIGVTNHRVSPLGVYIATETSDDLNTIIQAVHDQMVKPTSDERDLENGGWDINFSIF